LNKPRSIARGTRRFAVLVDLDGTLVDVYSIRHLVRERPRNFDAFHSASSDAPANHIVIQVVDRLRELGFQILVLSGRPEKWRALSMDWLQKNGIPDDQLYMRAENDFRPDQVVKKEMYSALEAHFEVTLAIDDNPKVVELWRSLRIPTVVVPGWE